MTISTRTSRRSVVVAFLALATAALLAPAGRAGHESTLLRPDGPDGRVVRHAHQTVNGGMTKSLMQAHLNREARDAELAAGPLTRALIRVDGPDGRVERTAQPLGAMTLNAAGASGFDVDDALVGAAVGFGFALLCVAAVLRLSRNSLRLAGF
ncbi:MAG TPA: hypothetical protein VGQ84_11175 [Gaiellaceae bacterium]|jgi:hypothetical protein|nr:hypothetical protein [Gaiellaceae bacterium]